MSDNQLQPGIDAEARERIAELFGRVSAHERHCDERHNNFREFMAHIERETELIHSRLCSIWRWIMSVLVMLIFAGLGMASNVLIELFN